MGVSEKVLAPVNQETGSGDKLLDLNCKPFYNELV